MLISLLLGVFFFVFWVLITRNSSVAGLSSALLLIVFWNYGLLHTVFFNTLKYAHLILLPLLFAFYLLITALLLNKSINSKILLNLNKILLLPVSLLVIFNAFIILSSEVKKFSYSRTGYKTGSPAGEIAVKKRYPDIYLVILDEYASLKTIKDEWGYDNSSFASFLRKKGFFIAENSEFRYFGTAWNMASLLNLKYTTGPVEKDLFLNYAYGKSSMTKNGKLDVLRAAGSNKVQMVSNNFLMKYLKEHGYKIVVLEGMSQYYQGVKFIDADISFSYQNVRKKQEHLFLANAFCTGLIKKTILFPLLMPSRIVQIHNIHYEGTRYVLNYLESVKRLESPKFVYAHITCPHGPYVFDRYGNYAPKTITGIKEREFASPGIASNNAYLDQYIYITGEIRKTVKNLIGGNSKSDPVFILQNDHGPRPHIVYLKDKTSPYNSFNAVYFPDGDYTNLKDNIAPVNVLRLVLNRYFGENLEMLPNR